MSTSDDDPTPTFGTKRPDMTEAQYALALVGQLSLRMAEYRREIDFLKAKTERLEADAKKALDIGRRALLKANANQR